MEKTVLLVDDDIEEHEIFKLALSKFNEDIQFVSALNGIYALNILKQASPDWIFLDINMPGMNGIDTLYEIKKLESLKKQVKHLQQKAAEKSETHSRKGKGQQR